MKGVIKQIRRGLRNYGFFCVLAFLPATLWLVLADMPDEQGLALWFRASAKVAAFGGIGTFLVSTMLISRWRIIDFMCHGLDRAYVLHRWLAKMALMMAVAHASFLTLYSLNSANLSVSDVYDFGSTAVLLGIAALIMTIALIVTAVVGKIKHQQWIWAHRIFSTAMFWAWLHVLLSSGDAAEKPVLWWSVLIIGLPACYAWVYRVTAPLLVRRHKYTVAEVHQVDEHVTELVLKPTKKQIHYKSGQYAWLTIDDPAVDAEAHPFSLATADNGPYVRFTVKNLGDYTGSLKNVRPGAPAWIEGPYGRLGMMDHECPHQVWIAGGIGLAPFLSMARGITDELQSNVSLVYGFHDEHDAAFYLELKDIQDITKGKFRIFPVDEEKQGFITYDFIKQATPDLSQTMFMLCGPPVMMNSLIKQLVHNGVDRDRIHAEEFAL